MTANNTTTTEARAPTDSTRTTATTMGEVDQTHPETNRTFGFAVYGRGVAADGGRTQEEDVMEDVDHESDTDGADRTFDRGQSTGTEKDSGDE